MSFTENELKARFRTAGRPFSESQTPAEVETKRKLPRIVDGS